MSEGEKLRTFIDNQSKTKISIAKGLGMTKQNLFGLFKSRELEPETKKKFEDYFGKKIFAEEGKGKVNVSRETNNAVQKGTTVYNHTERTLSLERTLENMSLDKIKSTAIIERLVALIELSISSTALPKNHQEAFGPEANTVSPGFGKVNPSGKQESSSKGKH
jgi:hypothetical protein